MARGLRSVELADVIVPQLRASGRSFPCQQLIIEKVLGDESVFHAADVVQPSHASLFEEGEHVRDAFSFKHCVVGHLVSPRDAKDASQAAHIKESPLLPGAPDPGFAAVQKGAHHTSCKKKSQVFCANPLRIWDWNMPADSLRVSYKTSKQFGTTPARSRVQICPPRPPPPPPPHAVR